MKTIIEEPKRLRQFTARFAPLGDVFFGAAADSRAAGRPSSQP